MSLKAKVIFGNDTRIWKRYPKENKYENLIEFIKSKFGFANEDQFLVQFEDDENDLVTIATDSDCEEAFACASREDRKSLRIFVIAKEAKTEEKKKEESTAGRPVESTIGGEKESKVDDAEETECDQLRRLGLDYLTNDVIRALIPVFVRAAIEEYKRDVMGSAGTRRSFESIVRSVLSEERFLPLVAHELYTEKLDGSLGKHCAKMEKMLPIVMAMNIEMVDVWIPKIIESLITALSSDDGMQQCGLMSMFAPLLGGFGGMCGTGGGAGAQGGCGPFGQPGGFAGHPFAQMFMGGQHGGHEFGGPQRSCGGRRGPGFGHRHGHHFGHGPHGHHGFGHHGHGHHGHHGHVHGHGKFHGSGKKQRTPRPKASLVQVVNLKDASTQLAGRIVKKVWLMRNKSDAVAWGDNVELVFVKGNETLALEPRFSVKNAAPGEVVQVHALIRVPEKEGKYSAYFRLRSNGAFFGPKVWIDISSSHDVTKCVGVTTEKELEDAVALGLKSYEEKLAVKREKLAQKELKKADRLKAKRAKIAAKMAKLDAKLEDIQTGEENIELVTDDETTSVTEESEDENEKDEDGEAAFEYADELEEISAMGFGDDELAKTLLLQFQGDISKVLQVLLGH